MHVFITGGTRGIGHALVKEFLSNNLSVSFTGTRQETIDEATKDLEGNFYPIICDVRNHQAIQSAMGSALLAFGDIDIWINNAGVDQPSKDMANLNEEDIKRVIDINVLGTMYGTNVILNQMIKQNSGMIYNLEGLGSNNMVIPKTIIYGSSKRLITYFTKACKKDMKEYKNIRFGTIQPSMVFTDLLLENMTEPGMKIANILGNEPEVVARYVVKRVLKKKTKINVMNTFKMIGRFLISPIKRHHYSVK